MRETNDAITKAAEEMAAVIVPKILERSGKPISAWTGADLETAVSDNLKRWLGQDFVSKEAVLALALWERQQAKTAHADGDSEEANIRNQCADELEKLVKDA